MIRKLPWAEIIVIGLVLAAGAGVYLHAHRDEDSLEESKARGERIVAALAAYRAGHGTYPERLEELAPAWIPAIDPPTWGLGRWHYRRYAPADSVTRDSASDSVRDLTRESVREPARESVRESVRDSVRDSIRRSPQNSPRVYFQLSVAANESGYPILYYDFPAQRWVLNN